MRTLIVASGVDMFHICLNSAWAVAVSRKAVGRTVHWRYSLFLWVVNRFYILRIPQRSFVCMETSSYCYKPNKVNKSLYNIKGKIESLKFKILFVVFFFRGEGGRGYRKDFSCYSTTFYKSLLWINLLWYNWFNWEQSTRIRYNRMKLVKYCKGII